MLAEDLPIELVWRAIEIYLSGAYPGPPPSSVRAKLETLRSLGGAEFYKSGLFERDLTAGSSKLSLRLGNRFYPHMKLTIEPAPDQQSYLFRADTHDRHICPAPGTRDYAAFCELMEKNQKLAQAIEASWAEEHLATFKTYLRDDLARRAGKI